MASKRTPAAKLADLDLRKVQAADLKTDPFNARAHNERNLQTITDSLQRFGQRRPLVVSADLTVVAGNGTLEAMRDRLGWTEIWVSVFPGTAAEARAFGIADNRTGELAGWDQELLALALTRFDPELMAAAGYAPEEYDDLRQYLPGAFDDDIEYLPDSGGYDDDPGDHDARYGEKNTWTMAFEYPNVTFAWIIDRLADYRAAHKLPSNADAMVAIAAELSQQVEHP